MFFSKIVSKKTAPTVYLHIGLNKTGTTSLQSYFFNNMALLCKYGFLYPKSGLMNMAHYGISASTGFYNAPVNSKWLIDLDALRKNISKEIRQDTHSLIFSTEDFVLNKDFEKLRYLFRGFPVKIIIYLRRHDYWWVSSYAQAVKMKVNPPWNLGVNGYIAFNKSNNKFYGNYKYLVDRWASEFGEENIIVRPYESQQNVPDIACDFFSSISDLNCADVFPKMLSRDNVSFSSRSLQYLDVFQRVNVDDATRRRLLKFAAEYDFSDQGLESLAVLSGKNRLNIVLDNMDDYEYIARKYLRRHNAVLFHDPLPDPMDEKCLPWLNGVEISEMVIRALAQP